MKTRRQKALTLEYICSAGSAISALVVVFTYGFYQQQQAHRTGVELKFGLEVVGQKLGKRLLLLKLSCRKNFGASRKTKIFG